MSSTDGLDPQLQIDQLDRQILALVEQRAMLVQELSNGDKSSGGLPPLACAAAAAKQIDSIMLGAQNDRSEADPSLQSVIDRESKSAILKHIASLCLASVAQFRVAFLGPKYSYSHLAAIKYFGAGADFAPVGSIPAVFAAVARGDVATGLVPVENSTDGRVVDTLGMFIRQQMQVCGEVVLPIHHNLLSCSARESVAEIHSKPQALSQCRQWLASHFPHAKLVESGSTTAAAQAAAETPGVAAVASLEAGRAYNLDVLAANIEDNPNNLTRFVVLGKGRPSPTDDDKTSLLFQINHQPGALADVMSIFKVHQLNLTWIESFPSPDARNEYLFFVELTGHRDNQSVAAAISALSQQTRRLEVLGSYPRAIE